MSEKELIIIVDIFDPEIQDMFTNGDLKRRNLKKVTGRRFYATKICGGNCLKVFLNPADYHYDQCNSHFIASIANSEEEVRELGVPYYKCSRKPGTNLFHIEEKTRKLKRSGLVKKTRSKKVV